MTADKSLFAACILAAVLAGAARAFQSGGIIPPKAQVQRPREEPPVERGGEAPPVQPPKGRAIQI